MLESLFNKAAGLKAYNFIKKSFHHRFFPVNISKYLITPILKNICDRLLLGTSIITVPRVPRKLEIEGTLLVTFFIISPRNDDCFVCLL